jgi:hypothetical protein
MIEKEGYADRQFERGVQRGLIVGLHVINIRYTDVFCPAIHYSSLRDIGRLDYPSCKLTCSRKADGHSGSAGAPYYIGLLDGRPRRASTIVLFAISTHLRRHYLIALG